MNNIQINNVIKISIIAAICLGLSACASLSHMTSGWTKKSDAAYLKAKAAPRLKVPRGLSSAKVGDSFSIPYSHSRGPVPIGITPPGGVHKAQVPSSKQPAKQVK